MNIFLLPSLMPKGTRQIQGSKLLVTSLLVAVTLLPLACKCVVLECEAQDSFDQAEAWDVAALGKLNLRSRNEVSRSSYLIE